MANKYTAEQVISALDRAQGIVRYAAKTLGCTRQTVYNYIEKYPTVKQAFEDANEDLIDFAEGKLIEQINTGNMTAIIFYLKTKAKHRGYSERTEVKIDDWRSQAINDIRAGKIKYEVLAEHFDDNLATQLFREAGVRIQVE